MNKFQKTQQLYDQYSKEFADKLDAIPETDQLDEFAATLQEEAKVLDLGCGSGRDARYLTNKGLSVIGVDLSSGLINEAKKKSPEIDFRVVDILNLDFEPESFDGVWSKLTILHIEREFIPKLFEQVHKILRSGGTFMIETKQGQGSAYEKVNFLDGEERLFIYYELEELKKFLKEAGFREIGGYEYTVGNNHATLTKDRVVVFGKK